MAPALVNVNSLTRDMDANFTISPILSGDTLAKNAAEVRSNAEVTIIVIVVGFCVFVLFSTQCIGDTPQTHAYRRNHKSCRKRKSTSSEDPPSPERPDQVAGNVEETLPPIRNSLEMERRQAIRDTAIWIIQGVEEIPYPENSGAAAQQATGGSVQGDRNAPVLETIDASSA